MSRGKKQQEFSEGDRVVYRPVGGAMQTSVGTIKKILTHPEEVGTRHTEVKASEEVPRYVKQIHFRESMIIDYGFR